MKQKHPLGLYILALAEAGERFAFYVLFTIFATYLESKGYSKAAATSTLGTYMAMVYSSPLFGGFAADRYIGHVRAVLIGSAWLALGYAIFALGGLKLMYYAFFFLAIGNGLFKPNISTLVGKLYKPKSGMMDGAFGLFYMSINIGAGLAPFVAEYIRTKHGWEAAFLSCSGGMIVSFLALTIFGKVPGCDLHEPEKEVSEEKESSPLSIGALVILCIVTGVFFFAFHQNGSTLVFWARENTIRDIVVFGHRYTIPTEWYSAINSGFVILFSLVTIFGFTGEKSKITTPVKVGVGLFLTALGYIILGVAALKGGDQGRVSSWYLISSIMVITIGEILISALGLAMVKRMAPSKFTGVFMGFFFFCIAAGNKASGAIGSLWNTWPHHAFWFLLAGILIVVMTIVLAMSKWIEKYSE